MDKIIKEDLDNIKDVMFVPWNEIEGKTILISGATGLIGYTLVRTFYYCTNNTRIIAVTRNIEKAKKRFADIKSERLYFVESEVEDLKSLPNDINYIIHGAANTSSSFFVTQPVECMSTAIIGTRNMLELAVEKRVKGFVFLSSMEVYGYPEKGHKVREEDNCSISSYEVRSSYPISKIAAESLCEAYFSEYGVPIRIIRLTQTFGPGVSNNDRRVFAEFARCAIEKKSIVLKTAGTTSRSYLYTADAVTAIITVMLKGINGEIYNASNENTFCTIKEMAEIFSHNAGIDIRYDIQGNNSSGYANELFMDLDCSKLRGLGWDVQKDTVTLSDMIKRMVDWMSGAKEE